MDQDGATIEKVSERAVPTPQMVNPDRFIDQNQVIFGRRRGDALRLRSLPPSRASRRALSRSIKALSASRTGRDFSFRPVKA
jgi:hypothetical protein